MYKWVLLFSIYFSLWNLSISSLAQSQEKMNAREGKILGTLLGLAMGDAYGVPTETMTQKEIKEIFGEHGFFYLSSSIPLHILFDVRGEKKFLRTRIPQHTSDDTQQALLLILALLSHPQWGEDGLKAYSQLLVDAMNAGVLRGYGKMFHSSLIKLSEGFPYTQSGSSSAGIGAAMRVGPLAGIQTISESTLKEVVITSSLVTHADVRAATLSFAVFQINRWLIQGKSVQWIRNNLAVTVEEVEKHIWQMSRSGWKIDTTDFNAVSRVLRKSLSNSGQLSNEQISNLVMNLATPYMNQTLAEQMHPNNPFVLLGGLHALLLALKDYSFDPNETLKYIVNLGQDTDTVGAIFGSIAGARSGIEWMSLTSLNDWRRIVSYSNAILKGDPPETFQKFIENEKEISSVEENFHSHLSDDILPQLKKNQEPGNNRCAIFLNMESTRQLKRLGSTIPTPSGGGYRIITIEKK